MLVFSTNCTVTVGLNDYMIEAIKYNARHTDDTSPKVCQELGDLYLRVADPMARVTVTEDVNPHAYIHTAQINNEINEVKKFVPIVREEETEAENYNGYGISESVLGYADCNLQGIENRDEFKEMLIKYCTLAKKVLVEDDIDLSLTMYKALSGNTTAITNLKAIKDKYDEDYMVEHYGEDYKGFNASDILYTIMSNDWTSVIKIKAA